MNAFTRLDLSPFARGTIGFDRLLNSLADHPSKYPPYNIVYLGGDSDKTSSYRIEVAVAGFAENELEVTVKDSELSITGTKTVSPEPDYAYKGISTKNFVQTFTLGEYVEVTGASVKNGLLEISLERVIPVEAQPKKIEISYQK